jgi:hypothetical protein
MILVFFLLIAGCQTVQPKIVLEPPSVVVPASEFIQNITGAELSTLIDVRDLRWDPVLVGKDKNERYVDLNQGHKMHILLKADTLNILASQGISASYLRHWMGQNRTLNIVILEIAIGQGEFAEAPSKALGLREKKWLPLSVGPKGSGGGGPGMVPLNSNRQAASGWGPWGQFKIPLLKRPNGGSINDIGARVCLGVEILDADRKPLFRQLLVGHELQPFPEDQKFNNMAQKALTKAYGQALLRLLDLVVQPTIVPDTKL